MSTVYPWQKGQWQSVIQSCHEGRMPHALLLTGPEDTGKHDFAMALARLVLCKKSDTNPCGKCKDCLLFNAGSHPDIIRIHPENKQQIKIGQIRTLADFMGCRAHQGGYRVVILSPAERMNVYSSNALLKSLEEPGDNTLILLISSRNEQLLQTIVSRCQRIVFPQPDRDMSVKWLQGKSIDTTQAITALNMTHGRPLAALRCLSENMTKKWSLLEKGLISVLTEEQSIVAVARTWQGLEAIFVLEWVLALVVNIIRYKMTNDVKYLSLPSYKEIISSLTSSVSTVKIMKYHDWLLELFNQLNHHININPQLLNEALLTRWQCLFLDT